ncbi:MAG: matrixin family metalloprotease [Myxococcota bacterium]
MTSRRALPILILFLLPLHSKAFEIATDREGRPLMWPEPEDLRFVVHLPEHVEQNLPANDEIVAALHAAADAWSEVDGSGLSVTMEVAPPGARLPKAGYDAEDPDAPNAILFETEEWRHQPGAFAVTLRTYGRSTAHLLHADIVVNAVDYRWEVLEARCPPDPDGAGPVDMQAVMTHELGHALGFEHTAVRPSVMCSTVDFGEIWMRELEETDREGLRRLYAPSEDWAAGHEHSEPVAADTLALYGCSSSMSKDGSLLLIGGLLLPMGALMSCRLLKRTGSGSDAPPAADNVHGQGDGHVQDGAIPE